MSNNTRLQEINRRLEVLAALLRQAEVLGATEPAHAYMREIVRIGKEALAIIEEAEER